MKQIRYPVLSVFLPLVLLAALVLPGLAAAQPIRVLVSTFPVYQFTRNITQGSTALQIELMLPAQLGCPHDYALTPQDMRKLESAQIFIINGLGMEEFLGAPLKKANPKLQVVDSSAGIGDILNYSDAAEGEEADDDDHRHHEATHVHSHEHDAQQRHHEHSEHHHGHDEHHHHHSGPNPHLFASPRMAALQVANIAKALATAAPGERELLSRNAQAYIQKLDALDEAFEQLGKRLANKRIVTQHGVFDYLARDMGLNIVAVIAAHPGQEPSAAEALKLVRTIKDEKAGALFTEPQYPDGIGRTLAKESGIPTSVLDPVASGPENAPLDYYERIMRANLASMADTLGTK